MLLRGNAIMLLVEKNKGVKLKVESKTFLLFILMYQLRGVLRTQSNIQDVNFCGNGQKLSVVNFSLLLMALNLVGNGACFAPRKLCSLL